MGHTKTTFAFSHIKKIGKVKIQSLVLKKRTFNVGVCLEMFLMTRATSPSRGMRSNGGGVRICMEEKHDAIHGIAWEFREL